MRIIVALLVVVLPITLFSIDLRDYKFPDSFYQEAYLRGNFNFRDGNQDQSSYDGSFGGDYNINYSSLPFTWRLFFNTALDLYQGPNELDESQEGYHATLSTVGDRYLGNTLAFNYFSGDLGYRKRMAAEDADDLYAKIGVGVGYGRVIDATVLAKAIRATEELLKYNVISRVLTDSGYIELAQIIDNEAEYKSEYGMLEYKKYWYEDMEAVFQQEGILTEGALYALGLVRLQEVLDQRFSTRKHGWMVRGGVGYILSNYDGSDSDPTLDFAFELAHPFTYKVQLIERLDYSAILADDTAHIITNRLSVTYEISNQFDWENRLITEYNIPGPEEEDSYMINNFESSLFYYLTNQLNLNATLGMRMNDRPVDQGGPGDDLVTTFFFGASYRLR